MGNEPAPIESPNKKPVLKIFPFADNPDALMAHLSRTVSFDDTVQKAVDEILQAVRQRGDEAVLDYTEKFQGFRPESMKVSPEAIRRAREEADPEFISTLKEAYGNILEFHRHEVEKSFFYEGEGGVLLGQRVTPMQRALLYVPGGKAAYPSSVLMNAAPARVAGVGEIAMTTPCDSTGEVSSHILAAASVAGISSVYKLGGAQAIAAFAYGTQSIEKVDIITGPGNKFVALAKKEVFGHVAIDSIAGPSEVVIIADANANPDYIVLDLFAQAEHDADASSVLITPSASLAERVAAIAGERIGGMLRREVIELRFARTAPLFLSTPLMKPHGSPTCLLPSIWSCM